MEWTVARLVKGPAFPQTAIWSGEVEAYIPVSKQSFEENIKNVSEKSVQLFFRQYDSDQLYPLSWTGGQGELKCAFDLGEWVTALLDESYRPEHQKPLTAKLPFHYHHVPGLVRNFMAAVILKSVNHHDGENLDFPVSLLNAGCEIFLSLMQYKFNYDLKGPCLVLTHDIDTVSGFKNVGTISGLEEKLGFRSLWNVVPKHYQIDGDCLNDLRKRGHEIGCHGIWHDNSESFLAKDVMQKTFASLSGFIKEYGIGCYRAPSWYRTKVLFEVLPELFKCDLSTLDNDIICPAGAGGVGVMRPFRRKNGLLELPCTIPFEAPVFFGVEHADLIDYWFPKIEFIKDIKGLVLVNTHSDSNYLGNKKFMNAYTLFLDKLHETGWVSKIPGEFE